MVLKKFEQIKMLFLDVDGVLTDGRVMVTEQGEQLRAFSIKDGYAMQLAIKAGLEIIVISGGRSQGVKHRLRGLGLTNIYLGVGDKFQLMKEILQERSFRLEQVAFMGDDIPDLQCMQYVGLALCPQDAVEDIKRVAAYVSPFPGGGGCVRDVIEKMLRLQDLWSNGLGIKSI
ncbi:MAG: KdsC family phosphatase [Sphingobacterium sp.]|uniref:KdsC family phosphatase n=1 Tax=Sphingobacterium sp. JB170 TaxID=1434842 RepID=UPI000B360909|nr:HAD hydrolase family protein [Sphingobacterium sp. JB170]